MLHVYYGDGKGKTCAAFGLALRMAGAGKPVHVMQFLKDGSSHEVGALASLPGVTCESDGALAKFTFAMTDMERIRSRQLHDERVRALLGSDLTGLVVVDEALGALSAGLLDDGLLHELSRRASRSLDFELVLTGREAPGWLLGAADYVSQMTLVAHPYTRGVRAREGVEY